MPLPEVRSLRTSPLVPKIASLAAVIACFLFIEWVASFHFLARMLPVPPSLSTRLAWLFEHQIWQFGIGMFAVTALSRGHLWSYVINSSEIRLSMSILLKFYVVASIVIAALIVVPMFLTGYLPDYCQHPGKSDMIVWILFQWMAAAVADEILYHGLFQTVLLKYWREKIVVKSFELPVVILVTSVAFAAGRTNVPVYGSPVIEYLLAFCMALYGGVVYYRTRSLLTPMLSQAFFYGVPFVLRFAYLALFAK